MRSIIRILNSREVLLFGFLVLFSLVVGVFKPIFLTQRNWMLILDAAAITGIIALGETVVIISGGIDISVGAILTVSAMAMGALIVFAGVPAPVAIIVCIAVGCLLGAINGALVGYLRIPAIIVTLATLRIYRGGLTIIVPKNATPPITDYVPFLAFGKLGPLPMQVVVFLLMAVVLGIFMAYTRLGRAIYAVGGNPSAASVAGVNVRGVQLATYTICGCLCAVAAVVYYARASYMEAYTLWGIEFLAIAAIVMGGTNIFGGSGKIFGTVIGTVLLYAIYNAMLMLRVDPAWQNAVTGALILVAVSLDVIRGRRGHV